MDNRHPSGAQLPHAPASDASHAQSAYGDGDPLFGSHPDAYGMGAYDPAGHLTGAYPNGSYAGTVYDPGAYGSTGYDPYPHAGYDTTGYGTDGVAGYATGYDTAAYGYPGGHDVTAHGSGAAYDTVDYPAGGFDGTAYDTAPYGTGDVLTDGYHTGSYPESGYDTGAYGGTAYDSAAHDNAAYDTASFAAAATAVQEPIGYEATAVWSTADYADLGARPHDPTPGIPAQAGPPAEDTVVWDQPLAEFADRGGVDVDAPAPDEASIAEAMTQAMPVTAIPDAPSSPDSPEAPASGRHGSAPAASRTPRGSGRGRRRQAKRSALLTVAVPSVAAMGVCAAAAASVSQFGGESKDEATTQAAPDASTTTRTTAANKKLDNQLAGLSASAQDFRERASRTQERLDLKERQAQERKRKEAEAARKEAQRPKFVLPVTQHGLSALFGQAGVNWMSVHTGIDFPVSYGTPVMAATDGTMQTKWNSAYGNMAILTAPDGTETWYCHLSSTKIRSGKVKAGDTIAYSGSSGNSTGPHLHFEVRPAGGAAVDPLPWLRAHGLNPN
ncbi:peptidoglycan DD-metalloendopeptidase family protein [Streptomyces sp. NPDC057743]|uniref:M23 family metallopeptidase n=1 Tax=Streptomyces sp. NPDC057743 TaxID=3346236 RepID=UPI0036892830